MRIHPVTLVIVIVLSGCTKQPPLRERPRARVVNPQRQAAQKRYAAVVKILRDAVRKGGKPNIETLLVKHFEKIEPPCRGRLVTNIGVIDIPERHPKLPTARLRPGLLLITTSKVDLYPAAAKPSKFDAYAMCFLSVVPPEKKRTWRVELEPASTLSGPFKSMTHTWREFPPGNAILTVETEVDHAQDKDAKGSQTESTGRVLLSTVGGRVFELSNGHAKTAYQSADFRNQETIRVVFLSVGTPKRHLMIEVKRMDSAAKETMPDGTKDWGEGDWEQTSTVYQFNKSLDEVNELKGAALEAVLEYTKLAPYRTKKSGKGADFD